jgi:hypothetical protein
MINRYHPCGRAPRTGVNDHKRMARQDPSIEDVCDVVMNDKPNLESLFHVRIRLGKSEEFREDFKQFVRMTRRDGGQVAKNADDLYREIMIDAGS